MAFTGQTQNINWRSIDEDQKHIVSVLLGLDFGTAVNLGYYRTLRLLDRPILVGGDFSFPAGADFMDDFKVRWGGQIEVFESNGISVTGKILANFRRLETTAVRMQSFGSEFAILSGYYKPKWHAGLEVGFDKAITTHLKHSDVMREFIYADVKDGWYVPTGGNWYFGLHGSKTIGRSFDVTFRSGVTNAEQDDENATIPMYLQFGANKRF